MGQDGTRQAVDEEQHTMRSSYGVLSRCTQFWQTRLLHEAGETGREGIGDGGASGLAAGAVSPGFITADVFAHTAIAGTERSGVGRNKRQAGRDGAGQAAGEARWDRVALSTRRLWRRNRRLTEAVALATCLGQRG